ncbi:D-2-hydroxyacid dehydrogenase family protein [Mucilaginibacter endophyticus]|uniref:D-2-hydroxyacid dehydrogenase family protein n=1 Tax=Mucilaginibacter endophyticus TaxID=2675003 RepID=UPI001ABF49AC|nr:D-2-hydroxyacid dehydrogenase family protein [Mucilaginibacter endophyticus]
MTEKLPHIAILDDYQNAAFRFADWNLLQNLAVVNAYSDHLNDEDALVSRLGEYEIVCIMRERTPFQRTLLSRLPNLKLIVSTGTGNASLDTAACQEFGIHVAHTGFLHHAAPELTWSLLMALSKNLLGECNALRSGVWQTSVGTDLKGKTIGIIGLGNIGKRIAGYAKAFDMNVIAWSSNLTESAASSYGVQWVSKEELLIASDFVSLHLRLSDRTQGIISAKDLLLMKPSAYLINTSRGKLVDQSALVEVLKQNKIAGAALDVFDIEPLPEESPFRYLTNVLASPHIGYVTEDNYRLFFEDTVSAIHRFLKVDESKKVLLQDSKESK